MVQKYDHPLLVLEYEGIDHLHVALLDTKLHKIGQILQALGNHDERPGRGGRRRVGDQVELSGVQDGGAQQAEEDEAGHGSGLNEPLVGPLLHDVPLEAVADVPQCPWAGLGAHEYGLGYVIQDLEQELGVGAGLGRGLDLVGVELAALPGLQDPVDGGEYGGREELGAHGAHVQVHEGGGQLVPAEEDRGLLLPLNF